MWRAFDRVERKIGKPLEDAVASPTYIDVMLVGMRVQRAVGGLALRAVGGVTGRVLRAANVPTRDEVLRMSRQMATLTREVRDLAAAQREALDAAGGRSKRPAKTRPAARGRER